MSNTLSATHALTRLGFDIPRFNFALRTALASALAMTLAWLIGLEHPQWSAMTVWAVSQPVRGMLLEKSFFRAIGTLIGTLFGIMLVALCGDNLPLMVVGLSLWVGLCVGAGNLLSGLLAYGTLLSGYSASMVALLNTQQPNGQIFLLGADRLATVLTGILVGLLVGLIFTPRRAENELAGRVRRSTAQILQAMAARFAGTDSTPRAELAHQLLQDIAQTEQLFDISAAGSLRSHRSIRGLRAMVQAQVGCVYWLRSARNLPANAELAAALERAAHAVADNATDRDGMRALEIGLALCAQDAVTSQVLRQLLDSLRENAAMTDGNGDLATIRSRIVLHRDWTGARHAMLRATGLLLLVGAAWIVTGWSAGAYVMLGVSVMIALFSNFETPYHIMGRIFWWQLAGAAAALSCHWLIWPQLHAEWQLVATLVPFLLVVALLFGHNRLNIGSIDYVMALLLLSHPVYPLSSSFNASLSLALAVVSGPLLAYLTFRTVWPADARRRRIHLTDMMLDEVSSMAAEERSSGRHAVWQARLYHRLLKLIQSVSRSGEPLPPVTSGALAVLAVGNAIQSLQQIRKAQPGTPTARRADLALQRLTRLRQQPAASAGTLRRLADHLQRQEHGAAWNIDNAARSIDANLEFFRSGALRT